ncbi:hypothetical protein ACFPFX_10805 [Streptomyces mauvecolor]|uniref:Uncharacterized protein n=1 Tax=Streptomyces mauvecolor TaxID=58345 RepID=A0ABV9UKY4_9ACTN
MNEPEDLETFCTYYEVLARKLVRPEQRAALGEVLAAARSGDDFTQPLRRILGTVVPPDSLDQDASSAYLLTELLRQAEIPFRPTIRSEGPTWPGTSVGEPLPQVFGCPARGCTRLWVRRPGKNIPVCQVDGCPLVERSPTA